jgi:hypothetical protein
MFETKTHHCAQRAKSRQILASLPLIDQAIERTQDEVKRPMALYGSAPQSIKQKMRSNAYSSAKRRLQELHAVREVVAFEEGR